MNSIPSVNLKDFLSGEPVRKQKFVDDITAGEFLNQRLIELGLVKK